MLRAEKAPESPGKALSRFTDTHSSGWLEKRLRFAKASGARLGAGVGPVLGARFWGGGEAHGGVRLQPLPRAQPARNTLGCSRGERSHSAGERPGGMRRRH